MAPSEPVSEAPAAPSAPLWRRALPFVLAIALVGWVVSRLDLRAFVAQLARVDYPAFLAFTTAFVLALLTADAFATTIVYRFAVARVSFREIWVLRGASYLASLLNHHVGQAFFTYFVSRSHGVALGRVAGATLLVYASWMGCLLGLAGVAWLVAGKPVAWLAIPLVAGVVYLVVIALRPARLARIGPLAPLFEAGVGGHLIALLARLPHLAVLFLGTWLPFWFFSVRIPLGPALGLVPIVMVATTLPLTPQGFGTRDVLAAELFEKFADGATHEQRLAAIAAATTCFGIAITVVEAAIGLWLMRRAVPHLRAAQARAVAGSPALPVPPPATAAEAERL
jgi:hypothetical protein